MASIILQKPALAPLKFDRTPRSEDVITRAWDTEFDTPIFDPALVYLLQRDSVISASIDKIPIEGSQYPLLYGIPATVAAPHLFAQQYNTRPKVKGEGRHWITTISWTPLEPGNTTANADPDVSPHLYPPVYDIEYIETEVEITRAQNLVAFPHGEGDGTERPISTWGPVVNSVGKRFDQGLVKTQRDAVFVTKRNFMALSEINDLNEQYTDTTNNDLPANLQGLATETLEYMVTESQGLTIENGYQYYPAIIRIHQKKTTQVTLTNMGYAYWDAAQGKVVDDEDARDLVTLKLDGTKGIPADLPYRTLELKSYSPLIN